MTDAQYNGGGFAPFSQPQDGGYGPTMDASSPTQPPAPDDISEKDLMGAAMDQAIEIEIAEMVNGRKEASRQWRETYRQEWDEAYNNYEQQYDATGKEEWQATTFQPMIETHVERATASLHNMSMGPEMPCEYKARAPQNEGVIEDTNEIVQHDLEAMQFKVHWTDFLRTNSLCGTTIGKIGYDLEYKEVMIKERKKPLFAGMIQKMALMFGFDSVQGPQEVMRPQKVCIKDHATFKSCDLYKIYPQPYIEDFTDKTWVIEEFEITNKELVEGSMEKDDYYRLDNVTPELLMSGTPGPILDDQTQEKRAAQNDFDVTLPFSQPDNKHTALEYWGPVPIWYFEPDKRYDPVKQYLTVNAWIWVVDGRWVVRKRLTPYSDSAPPYVKANYVRRPGQFYGIGIGQILAGLQVEKNEIRNTRQDNINLILNKVMAFLKDKVDPTEINRLVSGPGALWPFTGIDDVRKALTPVEFPDITADSWRGSAEVDREAQEATDVMKTTQTIGAGEDQAGNGTFRGQMLNKQQSGERFMLYARILDIVGLNASMNKIYERIYQYKSYDQIAKILGEARAAKFELVPPHDLCEIASLISLGSLTNENKGVKLAEMRDQYVLFGQEQWFKKLEFARKMYRLSGVGSDPDEVFWTDDEVKQFNDMKRQMMNAASPGGAMPGMPDMSGNSGENGQMPPTGLGSPSSGPIAGNVPGPTDGLPRPSMPSRGPGASPMDMIGRPAA